MRLFIWLCREAFDLSRQHKIDVMNGTPIDVKLQSNAASKVANNELTITIQQTIDSLYANKLAYFVQDIGRILEAKLYYSNEPQANRIEIIDPEKFENDEFKIPRELIESGFELPVLISEKSFKPRDIKYPFPRTFSLIISLLHYRKFLLREDGAQRLTPLKSEDYVLLRAEQRHLKK